MNNNAIDKPSYYRLKDGTYLEDALWEEWAMMPGPIWDACIYYHRAGHKDGEPFEKDMGKVEHYAKFWCRKFMSCAIAKCHTDFFISRVRGILSDVYKKHGNPWEE